MYSEEDLHLLPLMLVEKSSFRVEPRQDYDRVKVCPGHPHILFIPFISAPLSLSTFCSTTVPVTEPQGYLPPPDPDLSTINPTLLLPPPDQSSLSFSCSSRTSILVRY